MKKILSFVALVGAFTLLPLSSARADHGRVVGYTSCGKPIMAYHQVVGRDHCGRNVWQWITRYPSSCHCRSHHQGYGRHYDRGHCDSGRSHHRSSSGWNFSLRF